MGEQLADQYTDTSGLRKSRVMLDILIFLALTFGLLYIELTYVPAGEFQGFLTIIGSFIAAYGLLKLSGQTLRDAGLRRPKRIWTIPVWVILIFIVTLGIVAGAQSIIAQVMQVQTDVSKFAKLQGNLPYLVFSLFSVWITAAFMEEFVYRGFLLGRLLDITNGGVIAVIAMSLLHAFLFGLLHLYQGPLGIVSTGIVGFIFGIFFVFMGRNLWALILVHGIIDTLSMIQFFLTGVPKP